MRKFKKSFKKYCSKAFITFLMSVILCISIFPCCVSAEVISDGNEITITSLDDFWSVNGGDFIKSYDLGDEYGFKAPFYYGFTRNNNNGKYILNADFKCHYNFVNTYHYTISIPITRYFPQVNSYSRALFLTMSDGTEYQFDIDSYLYPDPNMNVTTYNVCDFFTLSLKGSEIKKVSSFRYECTGNYSDIATVFYIGLAEGRDITINRISAAEYDAIYSEYDPIVPPGDDTVARLDSVEDKLFQDANLSYVLRTVFNNATWLANVGNSILAAGMIFGELYNFGGTQHTWFVDVVRFGLCIGIFALILAIGPGLISTYNSSHSSKSRFSRSRYRSNNSKKGDGS